MFFFCNFCNFCNFYNFYNFRKMYIKEKKKHKLNLNNYQFFIISRRIFYVYYLFQLYFLIILGLFIMCYFVLDFFVFFNNIFWMIKIKNIIYIIYLYLYICLLISVLQGNMHSFIFFFIAYLCI